MAKKFNGDDMDAKTRHDQNCKLKEGVTPEGSFEDWGDFEKDYRLATQSDVKASTESEIEEYWSTLVSSGVEIRHD